MRVQRKEKKAVEGQVVCYHCGESCGNQPLEFDEKPFCCDGCKLVYSILNDNQLCDYYTFNARPGQNQRQTVRPEKFQFLDNDQIAKRLILYKDESRTHVLFNIPQIHCSSCLFLLEKLYKIEHSVISSTVNFERREVSVIFNSGTGTVRKIAELLASLGYEPYISLNDLNEKKPAENKTLIYQLGVAGFCFSNIMLMSFPEYFGIEAGESGLQTIFRWFNFTLSIPVILFSSLPFFKTTVKSFRHRYLHIDAPIALAILITFTRSCYEMFTHSGAGYFDSMTGIVFFMLAGRVIQDKTYRQLSFDRDYASYFPIAVTVIREEGESPVLLPEIKPGDTIVIHNGELIPADGLITRGMAAIDYSFVTGENIPVARNTGDLVYSGGKLSGSRIEMLVMKEVTQSYLTDLWSRQEMQKNGEKGRSFVHTISKWFTWIVLCVAAITALYWFNADSTRLWPAVTSIFIIACPCALLLANSFTNGNMLRILSRNGLYLRNAQTIENIGHIGHIVFDKTGTLTAAGEMTISYTGTELSIEEKKLIATLCRNSTHPLSRALFNYYRELASSENLNSFLEYPGQGLSGHSADTGIRIGSSLFISGRPDNTSTGTEVIIEINGLIKGSFSFSNKYRTRIGKLIHSLRKKFSLSVISGDDIAENNNLRKIFGESATILFRQEPAQKMDYIKRLQNSGERVMMIGDGLNDAGALQQSDCGIAVTENNNCFTPASDGIIDSKSLPLLASFISLCKSNRKIVLVSFILSILYNFIGLFFAVQGNLSPLIAAILMPASSLSILLITFGCSNLLAWKFKL